METHRHKMPVLSRASTGIIPSLISKWAYIFHLLSLLHFANTEQRWWRADFPSARLPSGSCGNLCDLALCSTLCILPWVLTGMCWRQGMLTFRLLAFLLEILSAAWLPTLTPPAGPSTGPGTRCGYFQYCTVSKHCGIPVASEVLTVWNSKKIEKTGEDQ